MQREPPKYSPRALCVCVRSRSCGVRFPPPLPGLVWRAHLARSRRWALVGPFHAVRAPPRVPPRSLAPFGLLWGGAAGSHFPPTWHGVVRPPLRVRGWVGGAGAACAPRPPFVRPRGPVGPGVALPRSLPLPSLGRQQSGCLWLRSGHGGRGPHTAPVHARSPSLGAVCPAPWRVGAGLLVPRGSCGSLSGAAVPPGGGGTIHSAAGGWGPAPPRLAGRWGGSGGGVAPRPPCSPSGGRPTVPHPAPLSSSAHSPPGVLVRSGSRGRLVHRVRPAWRGGGGGGAVLEPLPRGPRQTQTLPPPSLTGQHCGCHWRCCGHGGRGPHTVPVCRRVPPPGVIRAALRRAGAGSTFGCDPGGSKRRGAPGRAACGFSCAPPPPRRRPFWGRGGVPSAPVWRRVGAPAACRPGGERGGGGGEGEPLRYFPPSCPVGCRPVILCLRPAPLGYNRAVGVAGRRGRRARPGRPPVGQCGGGGGGKGGGDLLALVRAPALPRPASEWVGSG